MLGFVNTKESVEFYNTLHPTQSIAMSGPPPPGQQPSPQQMAAMQQQVAMEAQKRGMTPQQFQQWQRQQIEAEAKKQGLSFEQYVMQLKHQAYEQHQRQQQMAAQQQAAQQSGQPLTQGQGAQGGQQVPINPGAPNPKAIEVAKWLRGQDLKTRTCILNGQRKDMFRGTPTSFPSAQHLHECPVPLLTLFPAVSSQTCPPRPPIPSLCQSLRQEQLPPTRRHGPRLRRRNIQTPPSLPPLPPCQQIRPA